MSNAIDFGLTDICVDENFEYFNDFAFQDWELTEEELDIQDADLLRSTIAMSEAWEDDKNIGIEDMINQVDALIKVIERKSTYSDFVAETGITNNKYLN